MKIGNYDLGQPLEIGFTTENSHYFTGPFGAAYPDGVGLPPHLSYYHNSPGGINLEEDDFDSRDYPLQFNASNANSVQEEIDYLHLFRQKTGWWDVNHQWLSPGTAVGPSDVSYAQNVPFENGNLAFAGNDYSNWTSFSGHMSSYEQTKNAYFPFIKSRFNTLYASSLYTELIQHNLKTAGNEGIGYGLNHIADLTQTMFAGMHLSTTDANPWNNLKNNFKFVQAGLPYIKFRIQTGMKHQGQPIAKLQSDGTTPDGYVDYFVIMRVQGHNLGAEAEGAYYFHCNESGETPVEGYHNGNIIPNIFNLMFNIDNFDAVLNNTNIWKENLENLGYLIPTIVAKWDGVGDTPLYSSPLGAVLNTPPAGETNRVNFSDTFPLPGDYNGGGDSWTGYAPFQGWHPLPECEIPSGYTEDSIDTFYLNRRLYNHFWKYGCGVHPLHFTVDKLFLQDWDIGGRIPPEFDTQQVWNSIINGTLIQQMMMDWSAFYTTCNQTLNWENIPDETRQIIEGFFQRVMSIYILFNDDPNWSYTDIAEYSFDTTTERSGFYPDTDSTNGGWEGSQLDGIPGKINLMRAFGPLAPQGYTPRMGTNYASYFEGIEFEFNENDFDPNIVSHTEFVFNGGLNLGTMESINSHFGYDASQLLTDVETLAVELYGNVNIALYNLFDRELYKLFYDVQQLIIRAEEEVNNNVAAANLTEIGGQSLSIPVTTWSHMIIPNAASTVHPDDDASSYDGNDGDGDDGSPYHIVWNYPDRTIEDAGIPLPVHTIIDLTESQNTYATLRQLYPTTAWQDGINPDLPIHIPMHPLVEHVTISGPYGNGTLVYNYDWLAYSNYILDNVSQASNGTIELFAENEEFQAALQDPSPNSELSQFWWKTWWQHGYVGWTRGGANPKGPFSSGLTDEAPYNTPVMPGAPWIPGNPTDWQSMQLNANPTMGNMYEMNTNSEPITQLKEGHRYIFIHTGFTPGNYNPYTPQEVIDLFPGLEGPNGQGITVPWWAQYQNATGINWYDSPYPDAPMAQLMWNVPITTIEDGTGGTDFEFLGEVYNAPMGSVFPYATADEAFVRRTPMDYQLSWIAQSGLFTPKEILKFEYVRKVNSGLRDWTYNYDAPSYNSYYKKIIRFFHNVTDGLPTEVQNEYTTHTLNPHDSTSWTSFVNDWGGTHQDDIRNYLHQLPTEDGGIDDWELVDWFNWVKTGCINTYSSVPPLIDGESIFGTMTGDVVNNLGDFQPVLAQTIGQAENQEYILVNYRGPQIANMWWAVCDYLNQFPELISGQIEWIASTHNYQPNTGGGGVGSDPQSLTNAILYTSIPFTDILGNTIEKGFYPADAEAPFPPYFFNPQPSDALDSPDLAIKMIPNTTLTTTAFGGDPNLSGFAPDTNFLAMVQQLLMDGINGSTIDCYPEQGALEGDGGDGIFAIEDGELYLQRHGDIRPLQLIQYAQQNNIMPLLYQFLPINIQMQQTGADVTNQDFLQSPLLLENSPNSIGVFDNVNNAVLITDIDRHYTSQQRGNGYFSDGPGEFKNTQNNTVSTQGVGGAIGGLDGAIGNLTDDGYTIRNHHHLTGTDIFTSSINPSNNPYYLTISMGDPSLPSSRDVLDISWGHINGSGSLAKNNGPSPSQAIYRQAANELLGNESGSFTSVSQSAWHELEGTYATTNVMPNSEGQVDGVVANNPKPDEYIYIIRTKKFHNEAENMDAHILVNLQSRNESDSMVQINLTIPGWSDPQGHSAKYIVQPNGLKRYYLALRAAGQSNTTYKQSLFINGCFGYWYPEVGAIILNARIAEMGSGQGATTVVEFDSIAKEHIGLAPNGLAHSDKEYNNALKLINAMKNVHPSSVFSKGQCILGLRYLKGFKYVNAFSNASYVDQSLPVLKKSIVAIIKLKQDEFNFTTNPTRFVDVDCGGDYNTFVASGTHPATAAGLETMKFDSSLGTSPTTYITHVTLYDSSGYEIAVAKLSKPIKKDFNSEVVIKIVLNIE